MQFDVVAGLPDSWVHLAGMYGVFMVTVFFIYDYLYARSDIDTNR